MATIKTLKGLFWKSEEDGQEATTPAKTALPSSATTATTPAVPSQGKVRDDIANVLTQAIAAKNKTGYDYFEFAQAINGPLQAIPDESTRYVAAFGAAQPMGISKQSLLSDIEYYIGVLQEEEKKFLSTIENLTKSGVSAKESQVQGIDEDIKKKAEEIRAMTEAINGLQSQKNTLINEVSQRKIEIEQTKNNFEATLQVFVSRIKADSEKINKYIS